jgi:hypothetical protein
MTDGTGSSGERGILLNAESKPVCSSSASSNNGPKLASPGRSKRAARLGLLGSSPLRLAPCPRLPATPTRDAATASARARTPIPASVPGPRLPAGRGPCHGPSPPPTYGAASSRALRPASEGERGVGGHERGYTRAIASAEIYARGTPGYTVGINTKLI